jgi:hypothetical protein
MEKNYEQKLDHFNNYYVGGRSLFYEYSTGTV